MRSKTVFFAIALAFAGPALAQPMPAQTCERHGHEGTASPQRVAAREAMHQACAADLAKYCANVPRGCGRPMQCLRAHASEVSGQCAQAWHNLEAARS